MLRLQQYGNLERRVAVCLRKNTAKPELQNKN